MKHHNTEQSSAALSELAIHGTEIEEAETLLSYVSSELQVLALCNLLKRLQAAGLYSEDELLKQRRLLLEELREYQDPPHLSSHAKLVPAGISTEQCTKDLGSYLHGDIKL